MSGVAPSPEVLRSPLASHRRHQRAREGAVCLRSMLGLTGEAGPTPRLAHVRKRRSEAGPGTAKPGWPGPAATKTWGSLNRRENDMKTRFEIALESPFENRYGGVENSCKSTVKLR